MILDSVIVSIFLYSSEPDTNTNVYIFTSFVVLFVLINQIFFLISRANLKSLDQKLTGLFRLTNLVMLSIQVVLTFVLLFSIMSIIFYKFYDLILISFVVNLSLFFSIALIILTSYYFFRWFVSNRSYIVVSYAIGFTLITLSMINSSIYLNYNFSHHDHILRLKHITTQIIEYSNYSSDYGIQINSILDFNSYISIISFVSIWIPTVILLKSYSLRFGKLKFWLLVSLPLAYFTLPFIMDKINLLDFLFVSYDRQSILLYSLIFGPSKQVGGFLFGLIFLIMARNIKRKPIRLFINLTGIGISLLFGSTILYGLQYIVSPPFGVITLLFMNLASYMVFFGLYISVRELSRDQKVYRELYKLKQEFSIIKNLSKAEMERTLSKKIAVILNKPEIKANSIVGLDENISDYKEWVSEVMEVVRRKT